MRTRLSQLVTLAGRALARARRRRRAFTLIEVLIAVAALAMIGLAVAAVFEATGRTVSGGKRLAAFNAYAAMIESRMRRDFESMTRDGFLVIRNEIAYNGNDVRLHEEDTRPRPRRVDEIVFFAKGQFTSAREPVEPGVVARANAARIYYGHGKRREPDFSFGSDYLRPRLDDPNTEGNNLGFAGANRYAADWTLLRHVTLLAQPATTWPVWAPDGAPDRLDSDIQIALQPAASNIFQRLSNHIPGGNWPPTWWEVTYGSMSRPPKFSSGVVDIATTDLAEIRWIVTTANVAPPDADDDFFDPDNPDGPDGLFLPLNREPDPRDVVPRMQEWMLHGLPTAPVSNRPSQQALPRLRYEPGPTDFLGVLDEYDNDAFDLAYRRADQLMLSAHNFLPHCTEFIVEWSFGLRFPSPGDPNYDNQFADRAGELIWYGMDRGPEEAPLAIPYGYGGSDDGDPDLRWWGDIRNWPNDPWLHRVPVRLRNGERGEHVVHPTLIHGPGGTDAPGLGTLGIPQTISYFGYVDPTFNAANKTAPFDPETGQPTSGSEPDDADGDGDRFNDPEDPLQPTLPWAWPKLIRVTISLADPNDPSYEQTYQFIFQTPGDPES